MLWKTYFINSITECIYFICSVKFVLENSFLKISHVLKILFLKFILKCISYILWKVCYEFFFSVNHVMEILLEIMLWKLWKASSRKFLEHIT